MLSFPSRILVHVLAFLVFALPACGNGADTADASDPSDGGADSLFIIDGKTKDVPIMTGDTQLEVSVDVPIDVQKPTDVVTVVPEVPTSVVLGAANPLKLAVERSTGVNGAPTGTEKVVWTVNGTVLPEGAQFPPAGTPQWPVSVWKLAEGGQYLLAGVRPGVAKLQVSVDGVASAEFSVDVTWPTGAQITATTPGMHGTGVATRVADSVDNTCKLETHTFETGGLDATIRFPVVGKAGAPLDLSAPPEIGALSIQITVVTAPKVNKPANPVVGTVWVDQLDKGWLRGTFLGRTVEQTPVVGVFLVERDGNFGVDIQDDAQQLEASSAEMPISDVHVSRVSVGPAGGNLALITYRRVSNATQAQLVRVLVDAKTGEVNKNLPPLVTGAKAYVDPPSDPPVFDPAIGYATTGVSAGQVLVVWEGKKGKNPPGQPAEVGLWMQRQLADGTMSTEGVFGSGPLKLTDDYCMGECHPQVLPLPSSRFLVIWSPPDGGILSRRVEGDFTLSDAAPKPLISAPANLASAAVVDKTLGLVWTDPQLGSFLRVYVANNSGLQSQNTAALITTGAFQAPGPGIGGFSGGAPGFLGFAIDGSPPSTLQMRRFDFSGTTVNQLPTKLADLVDRVRVATGKNGQIVAVDRTAAAKTNPLHVRKFVTLTGIDPGTQVGSVQTLGAVVNHPPEFAIAYIPGADAYVVVWSGDLKSDGVWFQRLR